MSDTLQFFPTPRWLAQHAWEKFTDQNFVRVLDSCAGEGALPDAMPGNWRYDRRPPVDCIEIDASKHPTLREKGYRVVGLDALAFEGGAIYSHVILNPPFAQGAAHVLKAWSMLWEGEIVAIINAQTLRNPCTAERRRLAALIEQHGDVEFIQDAFRGAEVVREADVEIAVVHLAKPASCTEDWIGPVIEAMAVDRSTEEEFELPRELALPNSFVTNQVHAFRLAVKAMREWVRMEAVAQHYAARIGKTMHDLQNNNSEAAPGASVRARLEKEYLELKDRAWASVLRSTEALSKLSSKVQKQAESQFAEIACLDFTEVNIRGFLLGLVESQPEMQVDMACDVFDQIMRYGTDNGCFYRGWKSNDRHRRAGMRIKTTRIVLPVRVGYSKRLDWDSVRMLADFDRVFAMLDGKQQPDVSLVQLFEPQQGVGDPGSFSKLCHGERLSSSYLDVRFYPGVGTIHVFPRDKTIVDRLNKIVGRKRGWLPPASETVAEAFWIQYDRAEKFDKELRAEAERVARNGRSASFGSYDHPIRQFMRRDSDASERGEAMLVAAIDNVLERHGLLQALTNEAPRSDQLLLAA